MVQFRKILSKKWILIFLSLVLTSFIFRILSAYGVVDDGMRNYIPDELTVERRLETATHSSFPGGGATASVYKLTEEANAYIENTPDNAGIPQFAQERRLLDPVEFGGIA